MSPVLSRLKQSTWPYHKSLEAKLDWFKPGFSHVDYRLVLEKFWGYYRPMEGSLARFPELAAWLPDLPRRYKLPLLERDLCALGLDDRRLGQLPLCSELPFCTDAPTALGCLYVLEGSTLGGQVISQHIKRTLDLDAQNGAAFFNGYGNETETMWQVFRENLSAAPADEDILVQSACETFIALEHWLCPS
jgi:heme oxygenase (biliverdin-IX-beta and delta-forming)